MMRFRLLGPLEVRAGDDWRGIGAPKWRSVLAALLIHSGQIVSADTLISEVWRDDPPARAPNLISIYVLRLRRLMDEADSALLVTRAPGYQLRLAADDTDALLFEALVRDGRRALADGDPQGAGGLPAARGPVAAADARPGRRGTARGGARGVRAGPGCHLRATGRRPGCRAAPALRRTAGQGQRSPGGHHLGGYCPGRRGLGWHSAYPRGGDPPGDPPEHGGASPPPIPPCA